MLCRLLFVVCSLKVVLLFGIGWLLGGCVGLPSLVCFCGCCFGCGYFGFVLVLRLGVVGGWWLLVVWVLLMGL